jgi:hypothetical protein
MNGSEQLKYSMITSNLRLASSFEIVKLDKIQTQMFCFLLKSRVDEQTYIQTKIFYYG